MNGRHISDELCPTAAATLFDDTPARVVEAPASLTLGGTAEGLDARDALPRGGAVQVEVPVGEPLSTSSLGCRAV